MRRISVIFLAFALVQLLPARAYAWWEFVEQFSGPKNFYGWDIQVRLFCMVDKVDEKAETKAVPGGTIIERSNTVREGETVKQIPTAIGVVVSACKVPKRTDPSVVGNVTTTTYAVRRLSVDVGARFLHAKDPDFANGEQIDFTTLEPTVSINLLSKWPGLDFVDYTFGAGAYWFSSTEFPSFKGAFIEPLRFEFHTTTKMKQNPWAVLVPIVRVGWLYFPGGFDTAAWAARPGIAPRLGRDRVFNLGISLDLEPLLR